MYGLSTGFLTGSNNAFNHKITLRRRGRANSDCLISKLHMQGFFIGCGVNGYGFYAKTARSAHYPASDFTTISDQDLIKHIILQGYISVFAPWIFKLLVF